MKCCCEFNPDSETPLEVVGSSNCCPVHNINPSPCFASSGCEENIQIIHDELREIEVQKVCSQVLETSTLFCDNPNGAYENTCPFCGAKDYRGGGGNPHASMYELDHDKDCAHIIARGLTTNII